MKAIIASQTLAKELKKLSPVIKKNSVIPITSCVLLEFEKSSLTLRATDLETTVISKIDCECKGPFSIALEFSTLVNVCEKISGLITIDASGDAIKIVSDNSNFKFAKTNDQEVFPKIPEETFLFDIEVDTDFFCALVSANSCKSDDQYKPQMNTACIDIKKDSMTVVGIDGFVAHKTDLKIKTGKEVQLLVAEQFVQMVKSFASGKLSVGEKFIMATSNGLKIISRLMDAKYVQYGAVIPKDINFNLSINRNDLIYSLGVAGIASNNISHLCAINFNGGDIKIIARDFDFSREAETKVKAKHEVEIKAIGVNGSQLLKLLNLFDSEEVEMAFVSENKTIFLRPTGEPNILCLLQPLGL